jgi:hypothetical protein
MAQVQMRFKDILTATQQHCNTCGRSFFCKVQLPLFAPLRENYLSLPQKGTCDISQSRISKEFLAKAQRKSRASDCAFNVRRVLSRLRFRYQRRAYESLANPSARLSEVLHRVRVVDVQATQVLQPLNPDGRNISRRAEAEQFRRCLSRRRWSSWECPPTRSDAPSAKLTGGKDAMLGSAARPALRI